jgi:hypothetical protein
MSSGPVACKRVVTGELRTSFARVARILLLPPGVAIVVVTIASREPWLVVTQRCDGAHLLALPEERVRDEAAGQGHRFRRQIHAVEMERDPNAVLSGNARDEARPNLFASTHIPQNR